MDSSRHNSITSSQNGSPLLALLQERGPQCLTAVDTFKPLLSTMELAAFAEREVAKCVAFMARSSGPDATAKWNVATFVVVVSALNPKVSWANVMRQLDMPDFFILDVRGVEVVVNMHRAAYPDGTHFPVEMFWTKWKNIKGQVSFLRFAVQAPKDLLDLVSLSGTKILTVESLANVNPSTKAVAVGWVSHPWNSLELISTLITLADAEVDDDAKHLLDLASRHSTELVLIGLCMIKQPWTPLHVDVVAKLVAIFLVGHSSSSFVLSRVWQVDPSLIVNAMVSLHAQDPNLLSRILDVAQDLKALPMIVDNCGKYLLFGVDLAALAARREYLNLEKWLQDSMQKYGEALLKALLDFLQMKVMAITRSETTSTATSIPLSDKAIAVIMSVLQSRAAEMSASDAFKWRETQSFFAQILPELSGKQNNGDNSNTTSNNVNNNQTAGEPSFSSGVEDEANSYYEKIYAGLISIPKVVQLLAQFRSSSVSREVEVYACMVHNLFDEFRFFPKYPDKELLVTGELFGALIQHQLVSPVRLALGLRHVLDSLRKAVNTKMFRFGLTALMQFQMRLLEWPQYCNHLLQIPHLNESHPEVTLIVRHALEAKDGIAANAESSAGNENKAESTLTAPSAGATAKLSPDAISSSSLVAQNVSSAPSEQTKEKILFIVNNLSTENLPQKINQLQQLMPAENYAWFSHYLVVNRVSVEPNFHPLYSDFLRVMSSRDMDKAILTETVSNIVHLLASEKTMTSSQERTLLKNLGSWLGAQTLSRDRPIRHRDLAIKDLLVDGYRTNRLIVTIPFVCKVLEQVKHSKVFRPPNPWLLAILRLLVELYQYADLKLNLKFEIVVMCKNANIVLKDIEPSKVIRSRQMQGQADLSESGGSMSTGRYAGDHNSSLATTDLSGDVKDSEYEQHIRPEFDVRAVSGGPTVVIDDAGNVKLPDLASFVSFGSNQGLYHMHAPLKKIVVLAIDRAVREIIGPVVERSISIASVAAHELILKDFAAEPSEERMRRAAHLMVQNLAGNLAMVTSKEPFRISMTSSLKMLFVQNGMGEPMADALVTSTVQDNVELGCVIVEKAAMIKSTAEIDEALAQAFLARRRQRERGQPWTAADVQNYANGSRFPAILPEALRLNPGSVHQLRVYEDFYRGGSHLPLPGASSAMAPIGSARMLSIDANPVLSSSSAAATPMNPLVQIAERVYSMLGDLDAQISQNVNLQLHQLPQTHEIIVLVRQINVMVSQFFSRDEITMAFAQKLVQLLFAENGSSLSTEIYIILLERICDLSRRVAREFSVWVLFSDDARKYNVKVCTALVQAGLMNILELDLFLAKQLEMSNERAMNFAVELAHNCLCQTPPLLTYTELYHTLETLHLLLKSGAINSHDPKLEQIRQAAPGAFVEEGEEYAARKEKYLTLFEDWLQIHQVTSNTTDNDNSPGTVMLMEQARQLNLLDSEDSLVCFVRHCVEASVESYYKLKNAPSGDILSYQILDALGSLLTVLLMRATDVERVRVERLDKVLSTITLVLVHFHEIRREIFDQKPFFRLLSCMLTELERLLGDKPSSSQLYDDALISISNALHTLRPSFAPGFIFAWLDLVSNRLFLPRLMAISDKRGWPLLHSLLVDLFHFLAPFLRHAELTDAVRVLYKGTLRVLLLLLHDFPEFLCDYHFSFCDVIPPTCIQLRNLILSAFPRIMRLPDPFTPNLKVDLLPEINQVPHVASDYYSILSQSDDGGSESIATGLETYLKTRGPSKFISTLRQFFAIADVDAAVAAGTRYDIRRINAVVMFVGVRAVEQMQSKAPQSTMAVTQSAPMDIFDGLVRELDSEGRYHVLNAIANQLRFPNSHTHYFSCVLLYIFAEASQEIIQEQVTRVLLERLIVNRPHPWGLLITFIELLKNPRYDFWSHEFTRCAPDIERLFESVARSCMLPTTTGAEAAVQAH